MKYAFTAAALFVLVSAQDLSSIPACAAPCLQSAVSSSTSCSMTDYKCICNDMDAIQGAGSSCVMDKCGAQVAMSTVVPALKSFCAKALAAPGTSPAPEAPATTPASVPEAPASTPCTEEEQSTSTPAPESTSECTESTLMTATSTPEAMSTPYPESSSSVCEQEAETSSYAAMSTPASASASYGSYPTGTYSSSPAATTPLVQAGGNYSTSGVSPKQPVATAGAAVGGSVGALAAFALAALAI